MVWNKVLTTWMSVLKGSGFPMYHSGHLPSLGIYPPCPALCPFLAQGEGSADLQETS